MRKSQKDALGVEHLFESIAIFEQNVALIGSIVARQMFAFATFGGAEPLRILDQEACPASQTLRVGVVHDWSNRGPVFIMPIDKSLSPARRGV